MAKRFIDTGLFDDSWFLDLSSDAKLLWIYFITKCDHAGIYSIGKKLACFQTGIKELDNCYETLIKELGNRLILLEDGKYFIPKFITFQYPKGLSDNVKAQKSVKDILEKRGLNLNSSLRVNKELPDSYLTVQDKDKDIDKDKDKDKDIRIVKNPINLKLMEKIKAEIHLEKVRNNFDGEINEID